MAKKMEFRKQSDGAYYVYKAGELVGMVSKFYADEVEEFKQKYPKKKYRLWSYDSKGEAFLGLNPVWFARNLDEAKQWAGILFKGE